MKVFIQCVGFISFFSDFKELISKKNLFQITYKGRERVKKLLLKKREKKKFLRKKFFTKNPSTCQYTKYLVAMYLVINSESHKNGRQ